MITLPENLNIKNIKEVQEMLLSCLEQAGTNKLDELNLDLGNLRDIDTAGVQLLLSAGLTFKNEGIILRMVNTKPFIKELFKLSGAADIVELN